ncbi:NlpC/P60 family protein [Hathewaya histolytica]|uniref:NlpC/P60 family protein n=1 Tax=Hathewaya histolytica TaxID=1498 RepID=UPI003B681F80
MGIKNVFGKSLLALTVSTLILGYSSQSTLADSSEGFNYNKGSDGWWGVSQGYDANKTSGRVVNGDFDGDGKDDVATFYDYDGGTRIHVWSSSGNNFNYSNGADGWWRVDGGYDAKKIASRVVSGDFNGDGKDDIAAFYDYDGATKIHVWTSSGNKFNYSNGANGWWGVSGGYDANKITGRVVSGDFNGDGKDDIAAFHDYDGGTKLHVWISSGNKFSYSNGANGWWGVDRGYDANKITGRVVCGDFNGDGKDDIAAFHDYGGGTKMHVWTSSGNNFNYSNGANGWWGVDRGYDANRITGRVVSGDFNGDGKDDVASFHDYDGATKIHVWTSSGNNFNYSNGANGWWGVDRGYDANRITGRVVSGDFNGDGTCDIAAIHSYFPGSTKIHVWTSKVNSRQNQVVQYAKKFLGRPYSWGGNGPDRFDCSGLVKYVYGHFNINLPRTSEQQVNCGVHVSRNNLRPGDLVFFHSAGHVGIYIGNNEYIHAPSTGDVVKISNLDGRRDYYTARRILN